MEDVLLFPSLPPRVHLCVIVFKKRNFWGVVRFSRAHVCVSAGSRGRNVYVLYELRNMILSEWEC